MELPILICNCCCGYCALFKPTPALVCTQTRCHVRLTDVFWDVKSLCPHQQPHLAHHNRHRREFSVEIYPEMYEKIQI